MSKTAVSILKWVIADDDSKQHLAKSVLFHSHNGIGYSMVRDELVIEAMKQIAELVYDECWSKTSEGWNGEIQPHLYRHGPDELSYNEQKENLINELFPTTKTISIE